MKTVAILISTYNGERFLREQLDSILAQDGVAIQVFIRDDGSSDNTRDILAEYANKNANVHYDLAQNVGVGNSFMQLLYSVSETFDYYAFADQDDIWQTNKIQEAIEVIESKGAYLYTSNQECVDKTGNTIKIRYREDEKINLTPLAILQKNMLAGCTMVFINSFFKILREPSHRPSENLLYNRIHDVWVAFVASLFNGIIYDNRSFIKYRQHEANVVGIKRKRGERLKKLKNKKLRNGRSLLAQEACDKFSGLIDENSLIYWSAKAKTIKGKNVLIKHRKEICRWSGESRLGFVGKVILGLY